MTDPSVGVSRADLAAWLEKQTGTPSAVGLSREWALSSYLVRSTWEGQHTIALGCDVSGTVAAGAAVDLLAWHLGSGDGDREEVTMIVCSTQSEAADVVRTVRASLVGPPAIRLMTVRRGTDGELERTMDDGAAFDFAQSKEAVTWAPLLERARTAKAQGVAAELAGLIGDDRLRYYPMLSGSKTEPKWSVRLDGLEVGQVNAKKGRLRVGGRPKADAGASKSRAAEAWRKASKSPEVYFGDWESNQPTVPVDVAAATVHRLIEVLPSEGKSAVDHGQSEHALESHVVRGLARVSTGDLELETVFHDPLISRGSQFPTQWSKDGRPKYLDALLHHGSTPWAVELKVGGNAGAYYRHGISQAVLYRHFIRSATALHPWFAAEHLEAESCRAAVAFPHGQAQAARVDDLREVAALLDVAVCEITGWV